MVETRQIRSAAPTPREVRALLRGLRDRNLVSRHVAIRSGYAVSLEGCCSLDQPAEAGVDYRLALPGETDGRLHLRAGADGVLEVWISPGGEPARPSLRIELERGTDGRLSSRRLGMRLDPDRGVTERDLEHLMRRVLRRALAEGPVLRS